MKFKLLKILRSSNLYIYFVMTTSYLSNAIDPSGNIFTTYWTNSGGGGYDVVVNKTSDNNITLWSKHVSSQNTPSDLWYPSVTTDNLGNCYCSFPTTGTITGGTKTGVWDIVVFKLDKNGNLKWIKQNSSFNTSGTNLYPVIVCDNSNFAYICYQTTGISSGQAHIGGIDIVVFKLDGNGNCLWIKQNNNFNTSFDDITPQITTDINNNIYVAYNTMGGTMTGQTITGTSDIVVFKLDSNGNFKWIKQNSSFNTNKNNQLPNIAVDRSMNVFISFVTDGITSGQTYSGLTDIVVFKLNSNGQTLWVTQQPTFNTISYDDSPSLATDFNGNVFIAFCTNGTVSGQTKTGTSYNIVVMKLNSNGQNQWIQQQPDFNTTGENINPVIKVDSFGSVIVSYASNGNISGFSSTQPFNIITFKLLTSNELSPSITCDSLNNIYYAFYSDRMKSDNTYDLNIIKKNQNGDTLWINTSSIFNTIYSNLNPSILACNSGIYVAFQTSGQVSGGILRYPYDIVVLKLNSNGQILWIKQEVTFNTTKSDESPSLDCDNNGHLYITFQTSGRVSNGYRSAQKDRYDIAVFKMDSNNGSLLWVKQSKYYNSSFGGRNPYIMCDRSNKNMLYIAYTTDGIVNLQQTSGYSDIVITKLNNDGQIQYLPNGQLWILQKPLFNTGAFDEIPSLCSDNLGYIYLCYSTTQYGPISGQLSPIGHVSGQTSSGGSDIVIGKLDSDGNVIKIVQNHTFNTPLDELQPKMKYYKGYLYITYQTNGTVSGQQQSGQFDIVVMKVNSVTLDVIWVRQNNMFNTSGNDTTPDITIDSFGNCYFSYETTGTFYGQNLGSSHQAIIVGKITYDGKFMWAKR